MSTLKSTSKSRVKSTSPVPAASASSSAYSTYPLPKLLLLWDHGELTPEQTIGHLLQHIAELEKRVHHLEHPPVHISRT